MSESHETLRTADLTAPRYEDSGTTTAPDTDDSLPLLGPFTLVERIGGGGFAEVFRAVHRATGKEYALKVLRREYETDSHAVARFLREAQLASQLKHPNLVRIYATQVADGRHFHVMRLIRGANLLTVLAKAPGDVKLAVQWMVELADALALVHQLGMLHRDLKPANILIEHPGGRPVIVDFGLAQGPPSAAALTQRLAVLGTEPYMPPEQADPRLGDFSPATDIYGLGATLYQILTGRAPFPHPKRVRHDIRQQIAWDEPERPTALNSLVPPDLETICLKCLRKLPFDRYATAPELRADLESVRAGRSIVARKLSRLERAQRWCRRRPRAALFLACGSIALVLTTGLASYFATQAARSASDLTRQTGRATGAELREKLAVSARVRREYLADIRASQAALQRGDAPLAARLLAKYAGPPLEADPRGFEWYWLVGLANAPALTRLTSPVESVNHLALSPTGDRLACLDRGGRMRILSLPAGTELGGSEEPLLDCVFLSNGSQIAALTACERGAILLLDAQKGTVQHRFDVGLLNTCFAVSPDDRDCFVGNADGGLNVWSLDTHQRRDFAAGLRRGQFDRSTDGQHGAVTAAVYSLDGQSLALGYEDGACQVWNVRSAQLVARGPAHTGFVTGLSFSGDAARVVSQSFGRFVPQRNARVPGEMLLWNAATGALEGHMTPYPEMLADSPLVSSGPFGILLGQGRPYFVGQGDELVSTGPHGAQRWDRASGRLLETVAGDGGPVSAVAMSRDGHRLAANGEPGVIQVWDATQPGAARVLYSQLGGIRALCGNENAIAALVEVGAEMSVGHEGTQFAASEGRAVVLLNLPTETAIRTPVLPAARERLTSTLGGFLLDDAPLAGSSSAANETLAKRIRALTSDSTIAVSPDGRWLATGDRDGSVSVIAVETGQELWRRDAHQDAVTALAFSVDGTLIASGGIDRRAVVRERATGREIATLDGHRREISGLAFSPDASRLASSSGSPRYGHTGPGEVRVWDYRIGQLCLELTVGASDIYPGVAWNGTSTQLFAAATAAPGRGEVGNGRVVVWAVKNDSSAIPKTGGVRSDSQP